jgi:hypothetical protein
MELRSHPLMMHSWPPEWLPANPGKGSQSLTGEIGTLKYVLYRASDNHCFLVILHEGHAYAGVLRFDDMSFCQELGKLLEANIKLTIKEIGNLDLAYPSVDHVT